MPVKMQISKSALKPLFNEKNDVIGIIFNADFASEQVQISIKTLKIQFLYAFRWDRGMNGREMGVNNE